MEVNLEVDELILRAVDRQIAGVSGRVTAVLPDLLHRVGHPDIFGILRMRAIRIDTWLKG